MTDREASRPLNIEQQQAAAFALAKSGFPSIVSEATEYYANFRPEFISTTFDEHGNSMLDGVKGKPNSAGLVVKWGEERYPEIRRGELLGTTIAFKAVVVEAHSDGTLDVKGRSAARKRDWTNIEVQRKAVRNALEIPGYFEYLEPIPESERVDLVPYEPIAGMMISDAVREMVELADQTGKTVIANFNDIGLIAKPGDEPWSICSGFSEISRGRSNGYKVSPEAARNEHESKREAARYAREAEKPLAKFTIKDEEAWQEFLEKNKSSYGAGILRYAARWASMMEKKLAQGAKLEDIAEGTSHRADIEGMSGFSYGAAVSTLVSVWEHGDELRRWHNLKYQFHDEGERANESGGVLNPALLVMGPREN